MPGRKRKRSGVIAGVWLSQRPNSDSWCATWFDRASRQTRRTSLGTSDLHDAELALAEFALSRSRLRDAPPDAVPLETILMTYWRDHARDLPSAEAQRIALRYWSDLLPAITVAELTPNRLDQFVADLRDRGHRGSYINRTLSAGRAALQRAYKRGELTRVPFIPSVDEEDPPARDILTQDQARRLIAAAEPEHLQMFLVLSFGTLARPGAILELTWFQVDLERRLIDFNPPGRIRTNKRRPVVPICESILPYLARPSSGHVVSYHGKPVQEIKRAFRAARDRADLPSSVSPYAIRHTMATMLREAGVPEWECAAIMGHKLPGYRTTERYARHRPDYLRQAVRAIDAWMEKVLDPAPETLGRAGNNMCVRKAC